MERGRKGDEGRMNLDCLEHSISKNKNVNSASEDTVGNEVRVRENIILENNYKYHEQTADRHMNFKGTASEDSEENEPDVNGTGGKGIFVLL